MCVRDACADLRGMLCAVDLYVLERAMVSTLPKSEGLFLDVLRHYSTHWNAGASVVKR